MGERRGADRLNARQVVVKVVLVTAATRSSDCWSGTTWRVMLQYSCFYGELRLGVGGLALLGAELHGDVP
jgi:hypothetical protein